MSGAGSFYLMHIFYTAAFRFALLDTGGAGEVVLFHNIATFSSRNHLFTARGCNANAKRSCIA